jgi:hypothetical protein
MHQGFAVTTQKEQFTGMIETPNLSKGTWQRTKIMAKIHLEQPGYFKTRKS